MDKFKLDAVREITKKFPDLGELVTEIDKVSKIISYSSGKTTQILTDDPELSIGDFIVSVTKYIDVANLVVYVTLEHNSSVYTTVVEDRSVKKLSRDMKIDSILNS